MRGQARQGGAGAGYAMVMTEACAHASPVGLDGRATQARPRPDAGDPLDKLGTGLPRGAAARLHAPQHVGPAAGRTDWTGRRMQRGCCAGRGSWG